MSDRPVVDTGPTAALAIVATGGRSAYARLGGYVALTKPRIVELLLVTTLPAMVLAARGWPPWPIVAGTLGGGALAAGGASAANMVLDRDVDARMSRTCSRPLVQGVVSVAGAVAWSLMLEAAAAVLLWRVVGPLAAALTAAGAVWYVGIYTAWLKRRTRHSIVIGGVAGAVPALVGWAAVTRTVGLPAWLCFAVVVCWTPPHFWSLAARYRADYATAGVPMLPVVATPAVVGRQLVGYTIATVAATLALGPAAGLGWGYEAAAGVLGGLFVASAVAFARGTRPAMAVFRDSNIYLTLWSAAVVLAALLAPSG